MNKISRMGVLVVISSPSGTGKTTICKKLISKDKNLSLSISVTTRKKRDSEIEGIDYFFKTKQDFISLKKEDQFIETALVFDNYYGTLKTQVINKLKKGIDVIIDIDWQGTRQINSFMQGNVVKIFLLPPSLKELSNRLSIRGSDSLKEIDFRMSQAVKEIQHFNEYDYVLINDDVEEVYSKINQILEVERLKLSRQNHLKKFVLKLTRK
tara:strand:- start:176 stop:805 length:630 start_codon:yes stop_codon:yes gene_type:complete